RLPNLLNDYLAVDEGEVRGARHRSVVVLPFSGVEGEGCELPIPHLDSRSFHPAFEVPDIICRNLVPEAPASAVDHYDDLVFMDDPEVLSKTGSKCRAGSTT